MADMTARGWPIQDRFMRHVQMVPESTCWYWMGSIGNNGYGRFMLGVKKLAGAHRVAYELFKGKIPTGLTIDHLCRERSCVNPKHLEAVSARDNIMRADDCLATRNSRKTHCSRGHEYTPENTRMSNGKRYCEACRPFWRPKKVQSGER